MTPPLYLDYNATTLYVRYGTPLAPILFGANHEGGLRPGTENVPYIVGLGVAAELAQRWLPAVTDRLRTRRDALHRRLSAAIPGLVLNGHPEKRLPNTLHVSFPGVSGRELLARTPSVAASVGSACHEESSSISGVLGAMGVGSEQALGAVRLSVGEPTTDDEIRYAVDALVTAWRSLLSS